MSKTKVTERVYNKVHELNNKLGGKLNQKEIATLVNKHQTTVGRILSADSLERVAKTLDEVAS